MRFPIIKRSFLRVSIALVWMAVCAFLFTSNLRLSKQFTWGIEFKMSSTESTESIKSNLESTIWDPNLRININKVGDQNNVLIQQIKPDEAKLLENSKLIQEKFASTMSDFAIIGPSIGDQISDTAVQAIIWGLILMTLFIIFEFSKIRKFIQPWILGVIVIFTMLFDILSPMGVYGLKMMIDATAQVDVIFIIALLTTMGYSINDTVIIFDRIREHLENDKNQKIEEVFENSLWETMTRSLMTSISTLLVVIAMYILGTGDLKNFAFSMMVGVISGTFSSIFLAAPMAYLIMKYTTKKAK